MAHELAAWRQPANSHSLLPPCPIAIQLKKLLMDAPTTNTTTTADQLEPVLNAPVIPRTRSIDGTALMSSTVTVTPSEELVRLLPPLTSVWVPARMRDMTEAEDAALARFIRYLPVSPLLDHHGLLFLTRLVVPFFEGRDGVQVTPSQIVDAWGRHFARHHNTTTVPIILASLRVIFGPANVLVVGQVEIEHDATTGTLTLRKNAENYSRLIEFLLLLDGEVLA